MDTKLYVVFGQNGTGTTSVDVTNLGSNGFIIQSNTNGVLALGSSVSYAGDINGDGLADVIVKLEWKSRSLWKNNYNNRNQVANGMLFVINGGISKFRNDYIGFIQEM